MASKKATSQRRSPTASELAEVNFRVLPGQTKNTWDVWVKRRFKDGDKNKSVFKRGFKSLSAAEVAAFNVAVKAASYALPATMSSYRSEWSDSFDFNDVELLYSNSALKRTPLYDEVMGQTVSFAARSSLVGWLNQR